MDVHEITPVDGDVADLMRKTFANDRRTGYIKVDGCILPERYRQFADDIENFQVRDDDVWVCTFPKSGTTWTQEMVWSIANDLDFERGKFPIAERFPCLESSILRSTVQVLHRDAEVCFSKDIIENASYSRDMSGPRFIKTHLPADLLPRQLRTGEKKPQIIQVVRNPKDTCISFYHYCKLVDGFDGSFEDFATLFLGDTVYYAPWWKNVLSFWNNRNHYNMLVLKYEDMKKDLPSVIRKTATFLGKNLTNEQVSSLTEHLSFSNMKANPAVNHEDCMSRIHRMLQVKREGTFMRNGTAEQWKTVMTPELIKRFDDWTHEHLDGTELSL